MTFKLKPEIEEGNIEYKRKITKPTTERLNQLITQMKWRLNEGNGEAIYYIGVEDNGSISGISNNDLKESIKNIKIMIKNIDGKLIKLEKKIINRQQFYKIIIHKKFMYENKIKYNFIFMGSSQSGKSTLISYFIYGIKDDGNGSSRLSLFNHQHEMFTGKTSSVSLNTIGYNKKNILNYNNFNKEDIITKSNKLITLIDVPGNNKYFKTTFNTFLSYNVDFVFIIIDINKIKDTLIYIKMCNYFKIGYSIIFNKSDLIISNEKITNFINKIKKELNIKLYKFNKQYDEKKKYYNIISCKTLNGINKLESFLYNVSNKKYVKTKSLTNDNELQILDTFYIYNIGTVISGLINSGKIKKNNKYFIGPFDNNKFEKIVVNSIHKFEIPIVEVQKYNIISVTVEFINKNINKKIKKDMIITDNINNLIFYNEITIELIMIKNFNIKKKNVFTMYIRNMIRLVEILEINDNNKYLIKIINKDIMLKNNDRIILKGNDIIGFGKVLL